MGTTFCPKSEKLKTYTVKGRERKIPRRKCKPNLDNFIPGARKKDIKELGKKI